MTQPMTPHPADTALAFSSMSDLALRDLMLLRDRQAWKEFHRRYDRLVVHCIDRVATRFRSRLCDEDLREIYAQFFLDLTNRDMHRLRAYAPERGSKLGTFIGMLATNTAWDYVRAASRQPYPHSPLEGQDFAGEEDDPIERIERKQRWACIDAVLRELPGRDRDFVQLYYLDGLSPEAVAEAMPISVKTVYSKKHKLRTRLQQELSSMRESA
ncbi:MAG: sigma-70 family RNA polymerase sigma factor [Candidatus Eisenbacteria bacterium]|nr:sigma-70 family RNA polymerase sigma factor [Candidatus Eisenbacteria bacterium]